MINPLIALPCTARELETALHAVCDHGGLCDERIGVYGVDVENGTQTTGLCLITETETKGETK